MNTCISNLTPNINNAKEDKNYSKSDNNSKANLSRTSFNNNIDFSLGEYVIMQSFQDLSKNKCENEDKIYLENQTDINQNVNRTKRKYACSNKMMLSRLKRHSRDSNVEYSMKLNVDELTNFGISESKNNVYLNKSFDLISENNYNKNNKKSKNNFQKNINNKFNMDNSVCDVNDTASYLDSKRETIDCANQINFNNIDLNVGFNSNFDKINNNDYNKNLIENAEFQFKNNLRSSHLSDNYLINNKDDYNDKTVFNENNSKNNSKEKILNNNLKQENNINYNRTSKFSNNYSRNSRNRCSMHYEEINKSEHFLDFINFKIENFQKEMIDYLTTTKIQLEKSYKKFYDKVIKISADKARRISQVYTNDSKANLMFNRISNLSECRSSFISNNQNTAKEPSFSARLDYSPQKNYYQNNENITNELNAIDNSQNFDNKINLNFTKSNSENINFNEFIKDQPVNNANNFDFNNENSPNKSFTYGNINNKTNKNHKFFEEKNNLHSKELENLKNFANKYITERIDTMFELHENLKDSIKQNISLFNNFLNEYDFNCLNPMQEFINSNADEICNSWVLPKINFEKLNLKCILKNEKIPKIFRNFLTNEDCENKFNKYTIEKATSYDLDKRILRQNSLFLEKLILNKLNSTSEIEKVFSSEEIKNLNFDKIKKIKFSKSSLDYLHNLNGFKNASKLEARKSFFLNEIPLNLCDNFTNLTKISFRKCKLNNNSIGILMSEFEKLKNLEEINFANNDLTLFNYHGYSNFKNLHTLILRKNKISKFYLKNKNLYPQLEIVDLSHNNIVELTQVKELSEVNNTMTLISRNLALCNNNQACKEYLSSLKNSLLLIESKLHKLDLSYLYFYFNNRDDFHFKNLCLNKILLFNIKKLDLSFNNLYDEDLSEFFKTNRGLVNIKHINLKNNRLTESFFDILIDLELNDLYEYLEKFDLANNNINYNCLEAISKAFQDNSNLKEINLKNNPIENYFYLFFCRRLNNNQQKTDKFVKFFELLEKLKLEKRLCVIVLNYNSDLFQYFSNEAKEISSKFIKFEK